MATKKTDVKTPAAKKTPVKKPAAKKTTAKVVKDVKSSVGGMLSPNHTRVTTIIRNELSRNRNRSTIAGGTGTGRLRAGGSMASPLTEIGRTLHDTPRILQTTDGFFTFEIRDIESITFRDANGATHPFFFAQPPDTF